MSCDTESVCYQVLAEASPGLLSRLLEPFAKRDLTPDLVRMQRDGDLLRAEVHLHAMPSETVHLVAGNIGQVFGVLSVQLARDAARIAA